MDMESISLRKIYLKMLNAKCWLICSKYDNNQVEVII